MKKTALITATICAVLLSSCAPGAINKNSKPRQEITFSAAGDVMLARGVNTMMKKNGASEPYEKITDYIKSRDLSFCNLECAISVNGKKKNKPYTFRSNPDFTEGLKGSGFNMFSLANNHALDFGPQALSDTVATLDELGFYHSGAGVSGREKEITYIEINGVKVAFIAATDMYVEPGGQGDYRVFDWVKAASVTPVVKEAAKNADVVLVSLHWGVEYRHYPEEYMKKLARGCVDAGADIILGHHPHVLQGVEKYNGGLILYSMGNFIFDQHKPLQRQSYVFSCTLTKKGFTEPFLSPVIIEKYRPRFAKKALAKEINRNIIRYSKEFGTQFEESGNRLYIK